MNKEEPKCLKCGESVAREDNFCRKCGADLKRPAPVSATMPAVPPEIPPPAPPLPLYERKYGTISRLLRVLFKPSDAMRDIALEPDYSGVIIIFVLQIVLAAITYSIALSKVEVTGPHAGLVLSVVSAVIGAAVAISFIILPVKWLIKSAIVWKAADAGSGWEFKSAASVTGYAYIANLIVSLATLPILPFVFPTIRVDTTSPDVARAAIDNYTAQLATMQLYSLITLFVALLWKSYLGGVGTHYGTKEMCKVSGAFIVFFLLGLITFALSLIRTY